VTSNTPRCTLPVFLNVNIRGGFCQKLDELSVVLQQNSVDVACITETWLNPSIPSNLTTVDSYTTYRADRNDGRQGGGVENTSHVEFLHFQTRSD